MKILRCALAITCLTFCYITGIAQTKNAVVKSNIPSSAPFTEGILYTRVSFPGNIINELLAKIDFKKGDIPQQLQQLQAATSSREYADKIAVQLKTMTEEDRTIMGSMMMAIMMSPLYAEIYCSADKVLAKANAISYFLEVLMNTGTGAGKMIVTPNDKSKEAAIQFSASKMREVWEKDEIDAERYEMKPLAEQEMIAGYLCKKVAYTYKQQVADKSVLTRPAYKLIVWYSSLISQNINFIHPFYFQLDKGILKIEVHYDKNGRNKLLYEVTGIEAKTLSDEDFMVSEVVPVIDWDINPAQASMNILSAMMSSMNKP